MMNFSSWTGFAIALGVLYFGVFKGATNPFLFLDPHALILVLGGTLAATLIAFPFRRMGELRDLILMGVLFKKSPPHIRIAQQLLEASVLIRKSGLGAIDSLPEASHPFMGEAYFFLGKDYLDSFELRNVLIKRNDYFRKRYLADYKTLHALGKFPPAFGLLGATTGMISMMTQLNGHPDQIGPAMATALVATFWGIAVANLLVLPLADYANRVVQEDQIVRAMIIEGALAIREGQPALVVFERLAAQLAPHQRNELKEAYGISARLDNPGTPEGPSEEVPVARRPPKKVG